jgi:hypothetical protein
MGRAQRRCGRGVGRSERHGRQGPDRRRTGT